MKFEVTVSSLETVYVGHDMRWAMNVYGSYTTSVDDPSSRLFGNTVTLTRDDTLLLSYTPDSSKDEDEDEDEEREVYDDEDNDECE